MSPGVAARVTCGCTTGRGFEAKRRGRYREVDERRQDGRRPQLQSSVTVQVEIAASARLDEVEEAVLAAGQQAMQRALRAAIGGVEARAGVPTVGSGQHGQHGRRGPVGGDCSRASAWCGSR